MPKTAVRFICGQCGAVQSRWIGKCPDCGQWDTLEQYTPPDAASLMDSQRGSSAHDIAAAQANPAQPIVSLDEPDLHRLPSGIGEFDRVLGSSNHSSSIAPLPDKRAVTASGVVPGSVVLVGGDPGIGKSTLLLQAADQWARAQHRVLYVTSEESASQTRLRAQRLGASSENLFLLAETNLARIIQQIRRLNPAIVVIDSIQMIYKGDLPAAPGSIAQLRSCCQELVYLAKTAGAAILLVGHVTKQGRLAGPRLLEHMVDTVLYFEGDRYHSHRIVRAVKNRYGNTFEVGLFEMSDAGLRQVTSGDALLNAEYHAIPGSAVCPVLQGSRCLLVELQALTAPGFLGAAKRKVSGLDPSRLAMLIAVLEKHAGLRLSDQDVFASSVGGIKIAEPAADLAIALAIGGAHLGRNPGQTTCAVGEIGLGGEVRHVQGIERRISEAARLGFTHIICPKSAQHIGSVSAGLIPVSNVQQALQTLA